MEYKVLVNKHDFEDLLTMMGQSFKYYDQTNYYYDFDNTLQRCGLSLRIRHIENEDRFVATLKEDLIAGRLEHEFETSGKEITDLPEKIIEILNKYEIEVSKLRFVGKLNTKRHEFEMDGCVICFDLNTYLENVDYEIECEAETLEKAKEVLDNLLDRYHIEYSESKKGKQRRAKEAWRELL